MIIFFIFPLIVFILFDIMVLQCAVRDSILTFFSFAKRGFSNQTSVKFFVNEQITLGGDSSYYITQNTYLGTSKKPTCVLYYSRYEDSHLRDLYLIHGLKYKEQLESSARFRFNHNMTHLAMYDSYSEVMEVCLELRTKYEEREQEQLQKEENQSLKQVIKVNTYEV